MSILTYRNTEIEQRQSDGYVNLTQMAKANDVRVNNWYQLNSSKAYIEAVSSDTGIPVSQLIIVQKGNSRHNQQIEMAAIAGIAGGVAQMTLI